MRAPHSQQGSGSNPGPFGFLKHPYILIAVFVVLCGALAVMIPVMAQKDKADAATGTASATEEKPLKALDATSFTLENGMDVVVIPNHRAPVVAHMVWYKVGAADEAPGESGLAHYVEHLMFKGTETVGPDEFASRIKELGGNHNAFTSQDYTAYYQLIAAEHLEEVMALEADRMNNLIFPAEHVDSERKVVLEERRQRTENDPRGYFYEQMQSTLFTNHPYSDPVIGWLHELDALDRPHVKAFYDRWYAPNNAILVVAGDITADALKPLAEKTYGALPAEDIPERHWTEVPPLLGLQSLSLRDPSIRQPVLSRLYRTPSYRQNREDALALQVLEEILSGGAATRLYKTLVVDQKLATSANMSYSPMSWSDSIARFGLVPAPGVELMTLEEALNQLLRDLIEEGVTATEMAEAKRRMVDKIVFLMDDLQSPAMVFGRALVTGSTVEEIENWPAAIENVTAAQVQEVARKYLNPDEYGKSPYVTGYIRPKAAPKTQIAPETQAEEAEAGKTEAGQTEAGKTDNAERAE